MDEKMILPDFIIAAFFKDSLVEIEENAIASDSEIMPFNKNPSDFHTFETLEAENFLGGNPKNIGIVISDANADMGDENDLQFLISILKACRYTLDDISIFNTYKQPVIFTEVRETLAIKYFILFGVDPTEIKIPFSIPYFQVQQYAGVTILTAPSLSNINSLNDNGKLLKSKLWLSLQRCFNLK